MMSFIAGAVIGAVGVVLMEALVVSSFTFCFSRDDGLWQACMLSSRSSGTPTT